MKLLKLDEILQPAVDGGYAVPAFNFWSFAGITAAVDAAEAEKSPVIVQAIQPVVEYFSPDLVVAMFKRALTGKIFPLRFILTTEPTLRFFPVRQGWILIGDVRRLEPSV